MSYYKRNCREYGQCGTVIDADCVHCDNINERLTNLEYALEESLKLQSHYAELLNIRDGGERIKFPTVGSWLERLKLNIEVPVLEFQALAPLAEEMGYLVDRKEKEPWSFSIEDTIHIWQTPALQWVCDCGTNKHDKYDKYRWHNNLIDALNDGASRWKMLKEAK